MYCTNYDWKQINNIKNSFISGNTILCIFKFKTCYQLVVNKSSKLLYKWWKKFLIYSWNKTFIIILIKLQESLLLLAPLHMFATNEDSCNNDWIPWTIVKCAIETSLIKSSFVISSISNVFKTRKMLVIMSSHE